MKCDRYRPRLCSAHCDSIRAKKRLYVVLISTKVISQITVTHISTSLRLIFVDFDNPAQRKRCEFSKSYARAAMTTIHLNLIFAIFCRTIATIRNFAKLQPLSNVNPLVSLISLCSYHSYPPYLIVIASERKRGCMLYPIKRHTVNQLRNHSLFMQMIDFGQNFLCCLSQNCVV